MERFMAEEKQKTETPKAPKVIYWTVDLGSKGAFAPGQEDEMAKHITAEQIAELKALGAISGDWQ
jgi:hypothetical protein